MFVKGIFLQDLTTVGAGGDLVRAAWLLESLKMLLLQPTNVVFFAG